MESVAMKHAPKVGDRLRFVGNSVVGPCVGTVLKIYRSYRHPADWDWDRDDPPPRIGLAPEWEWHVAFKPDALPDPWCYVDNDKFAPCVCDLEPILKAVQP